MTFNSIWYPIWDYLRVCKPEELRTEYIHKEIDRKRKPKQPPGKWVKALKFLDVFDWYPSHYSAYERRYLMKVDAAVVLFLGFTFYTKYLDLLNISNAYVSGMKEELKLYGNELNLFSTFYNISYALFQIPLILLIQKQSWSRYLLLLCELIWAICTFASSVAKNASQLYAIRFFIGFAEAVSFPGSYVIMSTWYTQDEYVRRAGLYNAFASLGTATSGLLQTACREHLDGVLGKSGWRWQFIIDGVITMGVILYGLFLFPGTPETTRRMGFLTEDDLVFARKRMKSRVAAPKKLDKQVLRDLFFTWQPYLLILLWVAHHQYWYSSALSLYIKSKVPELYSKSTPTNYAAGAGGVAAAFAFLIPNLGIVYGKFWVYNFVFALTYFTIIVLVIWHVPEKLRVAALFLDNAFPSGLAPAFYSWAGNLCGDSAEKKQLTLALMNALSYATQAWTVPLQWNTKYSPRFKMGFRVSLGILIVAHITFFAILFLEKYDHKYIPKLTGNRNQFQNDEDNATDETSISDLSFKEKYVVDDDGVKDNLLVKVGKPNGV